MYISTHACKRYVQRILRLKTWTDMDIIKARQTLQQIILSKEHELISTTKERQFKLVDGLILVCLKAKELIVTLYPASRRNIMQLQRKEINTYADRNKNIGVNSTYETFNPAFAWEKVITKGNSLERLFSR